VGKLIAGSKSRTVSFRTSEEEFEFLRKISVSKGARSVSEFTRSVACRTNPGAGDSADPAKLESLLARLDERIQQLTRILEDLEMHNGNHKQE
jgi:hypothetical protein